MIRFSKRYRAMQPNKKSDAMTAFEQTLRQIMARPAPAEVTARVWADLLNQYAPEPTHNAPQVLQ